jgi:hypothetical protein
MSYHKSGFQKKEVKAIYFFGWGGHQKTMLFIYIIFLLNRPPAHLGLHETSFFILAGKSHPFIFPEQALSFFLEFFFAQQTQTLTQTLHSKFSKQENP